MPRARPDRRAHRTQQSLHVALNSLILEKGYEHATIKDITARANVGRSTFYEHHGSKEGLMLSGLQHLRVALMAAQHDAPASSVTAPPRVLAFSRAFFEHVHEYRELFRALARSESGPAVISGMKRIIADLVRAEFREQAIAHESTVPREALEHVIVDVFFSVLDWWFQRKPQLAPAQADAVFRRLALPMIAAAGIRCPLE